MNFFHKIYDMHALSPMYQQWFPKDPSVQQNLDGFSNPQDIGKPLKDRSPDYSINPLTAQEKVQEFGQLVFKITLFCYVFSPLLFSLTAALVPLSMAPFVSSHLILPLSALSETFLLGVLGQTATQITLYITPQLFHFFLTYKAVQYTLHYLAMAIIYPAQGPFFFRDTETLQKQLLFHPDGPRLLFWDDQEKQYTGYLQQDPLNVYVRQVVLENAGKRYEGTLVCQKGNRKWAMEASGNGTTATDAAYCHGLSYIKQGYNVLFLNGPGVEGSDGRAASNTIAKAQTVALSFLEQFDPDHIVVGGYSLGGGATHAVALDYNFSLPKEKYTFVSYVSFSTLTKAAALIVFPNYPRLQLIVEYFLKWLGIELDSVKASRKLSSLGIREVVVQSGSHPVWKGSESPPLTAASITDDNVIHRDASLAKALITQNMLENKEICCILNLKHNDHIPIDKVIQDYVTSHAP